MTAQLAFSDAFQEFSDTKDKKSKFLHTLKSPSQHIKYKRYIGSPIRYAGGKSLAVGHILELIPNNIQKLTSPFMGGGSVEVALARECGVKVYGFDIFELLTNYWQQQISYPKALANILSQLQPTKHQYTKIKDKLKKHWKGEKQIDDPKQLAAYYWFNHNLSYGPGFLGWMSKIYEDKKRYQGLVSRVRLFDLPLLEVKQADFQDVIKESKNTFLYCDPPYYLDGDSKMFRGIYPQRNFPIHHNGFDHKALRDLLHSHNCGFVLSYNDCSTIRDWYKDFEIIEVSWQYTMGQGETRIGQNRINGNHSYIKSSHEILIVKR